MLGRINGETVTIDGPFPSISADLSTGPVYKDSGGNWYTGKITMQGTRRFVELTPLTQAQLDKLRKTNNITS